MACSLGRLVVTQTQRGRPLPRAVADARFRDRMIDNHPPHARRLDAAVAESAAQPSRAVPTDDANSIEVLNTTAQGQLKAILERIERLEEDKAAVMADLKEVYAEAKGNGFDTKIIRKVVRIRKQDRAKRQEEEAILDLYLSALGDA